MHAANSGKSSQRKFVPHNPVPDGTNLQLLGDGLNLVCFCNHCMKVAVKVWDSSKMKKSFRAHRAQSAKVSVVCISGMEKVNLDEGGEKDNRCVVYTWLLCK